MEEEIILTRLLIDFTTGLRQDPIGTRLKNLWTLVYDAGATAIRDHSFDKLRTN